MQNELEYIIKQSDAQDVLSRIADEKPGSLICIGESEGKVFYMISHLDAIEAMGLLEIAKQSIVGDYLKGTYGTSY